MLAGRKYRKKSEGSDNSSRQKTRLKMSANACYLANAERCHVCTFFNSAHLRGLLSQEPAHPCALPAKEFREDPDNPILRGRFPLR